jgi:hypothetical protein
MLLSSLLLSLSLLARFSAYLTPPTLLYYYLDLQNPNSTVNTPLPFPNPALNLTLSNGHPPHLVYTLHQLTYTASILPGNILNYLPSSPSPPPRSVMKIRIISNITTLLLKITVPRARLPNSL